MESSRIDIGVFSSSNAINARVDPMMARTISFRSKRIETNVKFTTAQYSYLELRDRKVIYLNDG
jgi:hypothetical protein